ncbi:MAG: hypothetical protein N2712_07685 [Brevinematales bacterium]|nr:hypothetical protein [Brevinematales bacterium]
MRSVMIFVFATLANLLVGCVALVVPSPSQLYHKDNVYVGASIGYGNILQAEFSTWVYKQPDIDIGLSVCRFEERSYNSLSFDPYVRYWIKSGDTPFLNVGGSILITTASFVSTSSNVFVVGPSIFASLGYFGEIFSVSLTPTVSSGFSRYSGNSGYYLFCSLSLQMNLMPVRNVGLGVEINPGLGAGTGFGLLPAPLRVLLNITF